MTGRHGTSSEVHQVVAAPRPPVVTTGKRRPLAVASEPRGPLVVPRVQVVRFLAVAALLAVLSRQWGAFLPLLVLLVVVLRAR